MAIIECDACAQDGGHVPATGHSSNPQWSGYELCDECIEHYDAEPRTLSAVSRLPWSATNHTDPMGQAIDTIRKSC